MRNELTFKRIFSAQAVGAGASVSALAIDLSAYAPTGYFSVQIAVTGNGTLTLEYTVSNDGTNYVKPTGATVTITSAFTKTSGVGADGLDLIAFELDGPAKFLKITAIETGGASGIVLTADLAIQ